MKNSGGQPITIHQFHYTATAGDAVTNHMLFIRSALRDIGIGGEIFVGESRAPASYRIHPFAPNRFWDSDLVLVHHSHGNPLLREILQLEIPRALIYHNVTPPTFFAHDPHMARFSNKGRSELAAYAGVVSAAFGVSRYNCAELKAMGFQNPTVFPLVDLSQGPVEPKPKASSDEKELVFVGKLTPHKNQALLLHMLYYLEHAYPGLYRLVLAGRADPLYAEYLKLAARALGLEDRVRFTGPVVQKELELVYQRAAALVCPSLHEGFCVPLVEAMQRRVPVFAIPVTGVRETLGKAGVRLVSRQPHKIAESVHTVLSDARATQGIVAGQITRLEELARIHNRERVRSLCVDLVQRLRGLAYEGPYADLSL